MPKSSVQIVREMFDAWNARDFRRYVDVLDEGYVETTHGVPGEVRGRHGAGEQVQKWAHACPDLLFEVLRMVGVGNLVTVSWVATGTQPAYPLGRVSGCAVVEIRNGKIGSVWMYWDRDVLLAQLQRAGDRQLRNAV